MRMTAMNCVYVQSMSDQAMTQAQQPIATGLHQRDAQKAAPFGHPGPTADVRDVASDAQRIRAQGVAVDRLAYSSANNSTSQAHRMSQ